MQQQEHELSEEQERTEFNECPTCEEYDIFQDDNIHHCSTCGTAWH